MNYLIVRSQLVLIILLFLIYPWVLYGRVNDRQIASEFENQNTGITDLDDSLVYTLYTDSGESIKLQLSKSSIYHYEILRIKAYPNFKISGKLALSVVNGDGTQTLSANILRYEAFLKDGAVYTAVYMPPWNAPEGEYRIRVYYKNNPLNCEHGITFYLKRRKVEKLKTPLTVADLEMNKSVRKVNVRGVTGEPVGPEGIIDWVNFLRANALWILAGETTSFKKRVACDKTPYWDKGPLENLDTLKVLAKSEGIKVGAYVISFFVPGKRGVPKRYRPGIGYDKESGKLYSSRHISLNSKKRIEDIVKLVKRFQNDPYIDYIGFDFIRTGRVDGYELVNDFVKESNISRPQGWKKMNLNSRMKWLAREIEVNNNPVIVKKWRWWRAHRVALIVKYIILKARITKPVWVFTLGWRHGSMHGQDPVMFFDAGVSIDAVMLYEANNRQFTKMMKQWKRYMTEEQGNLIVGNCVDYKLLDSDFLDPPDEMFRRNRVGYSSIYKNGLAKGIFFHDIARAIWGRKGGYDGWRYALKFAENVIDLQNMIGENEIMTDIILNREKIRKFIFHSFLWSVKDEPL